MSKSNHLNTMMDAAGFVKLSNVQQKVIPEVLKNRNLIVNSPTGTGKTHAYLFGIFSKLTKKPVTQAIIVAPTRELAFQIHRFALELAQEFDGIKVKLFVGGEKRSASSEPAQVVIGTIGRLNDLYLDKGYLALHTASIIVLDEADMLVDQGFIEDCDRLLSNLDPYLQTLVFSATIPVALQPFLNKYLSHSKNIQVFDDQVFNPKIHYQLLHTKHLTYSEKVMEILPLLNPTQCLIFLNTKEEVVDLAHQMRAEGIDCVELHKDLNTAQRKLAISKIIQLKTPYVVATDIAARGLDFEFLSHVISCGFPKELSYFKHRAGRVGRAGKDGVCLLLVNDSDQHNVSVLEKEKIQFEHLEVKNNQLLTLRPFKFRQKPLDAEDKKAISKIKGKRKRVKPNYRKQEKQQIDKYYQKKRRAMIKTKIKEQQKERAKAKKRSENS